MKREKRLTKRERKATETLTNAARPKASGEAGHNHQHRHHIHCIACGKHLDPAMFGEPNGAEFLRCDHGTDFPHCVRCGDKARVLVEEHDRTGQGVKRAAAWH